MTDSGMPCESSHLTNPTQPPTTARRTPETRLHEPRAHHTAEAADGTSASAPLTALEDRLGLTPLARRRLQWEIDGARPASVVPLTPAGDPSER
jgi:hypothetical protein